jgi:hypothetical protein
LGIIDCGHRAWDTHNYGRGGDDGCNDGARLSYGYIACGTRNCSGGGKRYCADDWCGDKSDCRWNSSDNAWILRNVCGTDACKIAQGGLDLGG